jgi:Xaa-Pro aminopeptidase
VLQRAQAAATTAVRPGVTCEQIDAVARELITDAGYGEAFIHRTGHGIGLDTHEAPYVVEGNDLPLEPGMAFSVEPGIYLAGRYGARIEDIVVCTDDGVRNLNGETHELVELPG